MFSRSKDDCCVSCGHYVPEGRMVCLNCENDKPVSKKQIHSDICQELNVIYAKKNHDYGDSFANLRDELPDAILVRIYDKYSRLKTLINGHERQVMDESIEDTLRDLANYCIMELVERKVSR